MTRLPFFGALLLSMCSEAGGDRPRARPSFPEKPGYPAAPLLSAGARVVSTPPGAAVAFDDRPGNGHWAAKTPTAAQPSTAAVDLGVGPTKVVLAWHASGNTNYDETTYGGPGSYVVETSADSTDGAGGTWKAAVTVTANDVSTRAHAIDFTGQRWLRLKVTGPSPQTYQYGIQLDRIAVNDLSNGSKDTWLFVGDSITAAAFDQNVKRQPSFAALIQKRAPGYSPVMLHAGKGFLKSGDLLERLPGYLEKNEALVHWCIGIGSNNPAEKPEHLLSFRRDLEAMVEKLKAAGKEPMLARVPFQTSRDVSPLNVELDAVVKKHGLRPGPDFYAWFKAHPEQLRDGLHPNDEGAKAMNRLWADAVADLYPAAK